jgi:hypothetical protein
MTVTGHEIDLLAEWSSAPEGSPLDRGEQILPNSQYAWTAQFFAADDGAGAHKT